MLDTNYYTDCRIEDGPAAEIASVKNIEADVREALKISVELKKLEDLSFIEKLEFEKELEKLKTQINFSNEANEKILTNYTLRQFNYKQMLSKCNLDEIAKLKKEFDEYFNARFDEKWAVKQFENEKVREKADLLKQVKDLHEELSTYFTAEEKTAEKTAEKATKESSNVNDIKILHKNLISRIVDLNNSNTDLAIEILTLLNKCYISKL